MIEINKWLTGRKLMSMSNKPKLSFVVYDEYNLIAAMFVRQVEGNIGLIDGMVTNPEEPGFIRNTALNTLVTHTLKQCKRYDLNVILGWTLDEHTAKRAEKHGFKLLAGKNIIKEL